MKAHLALELTVIYLSISLSIYYNRTQRTKHNIREQKDSLQNVERWTDLLLDTVAEWLHNTSDLRYCLCRSIANTTIIQRLIEQSPPTVLVVLFFNNTNDIRNLLCGTSMQSISKKTLRN